MKYNCISNYYTLLAEQMLHPNIKKFLVFNFTRLNKYTQLHKLSKQAINHNSFCWVKNI